MGPTKPQLLRLALSYHKNPEISDEEFHRKVTEEHSVRVAAITTRHGVHIYSVVFNPKPTRDAAQKVNERLGKKFALDDYDVTIEFYVRNVAAALRVLDDPDFEAVHHESKPWTDHARGAGASLGWVEMYVERGNVTHVTEDNKTTYPPLDFEAELDLA